MKKIKRVHSKTVNTCSKSDSDLLREYAKLSYDQLMREEMNGNPGQSSSGSKEHEPSVPVVLFNSNGDIISFVSVETKFDENGIPRSCIVQTEEDIVAAADSVGWLSPIPSYGIPIEGGEDAFIEAHVEVSRRRVILDDMRRDIKGATARTPR
jgi:hypothetical protein